MSPEVSSLIDVFSISFSVGILIGLVIVWMIAHSRSAEAVHTSDPYLALYNEDFGVPPEDAAWCLPDDCPVVVEYVMGDETHRACGTLHFVPVGATAPDRVVVRVGGVTITQSAIRYLWPDRHHDFWRSRGCPEWPPRTKS